MPIKVGSMLKKLPSLAVMAFAVAIAAVSGGVASEVANISWDDLVPPRYAADSPLAKLSPEQQSDLYFIAEVRTYLDDGMKDDGSDYLDVAEELERELKAAGVDVDTLVTLARTSALTQKSVVRSLDGKSVRIPGYVLPLEYNGDLVKEFLLVPYVGACIHTPPPPENQIVYVKLLKGITVKRMYEPVWATGTLKAQQSTQALTLVDGSSGVPVGYQLNAIGIEPYEQ